ncbi:unnamed protein product [Prorocentrum cordatum]|uniref:Uncharacterized protein n=1 Tax=Prorocentrum cordatum TaxID=2364126 RepID=A0ABN9TR12_9DINO|nr:unnamed protein product [Polarella glacialis]
MAMAAARVLVAALHLLLADAIGIRRSDTSSDMDFISETKSQAGVTSVYAADKAYWTATLGTMNNAGVTRYTDEAIKKTERTDGKFFWGDPANRDSEQSYVGPADLTANISWAWHHPAGVYSTIPVGSPLVDDELNIYIGADDAIRKFDVTGVIKWSYAPRGQLAAAPTLCTSGSRRQAASDTRDVSSLSRRDAEDMLRPDWANGNEADTRAQMSRDFRVGDLVKVKPGASF